MEFRVWERRKLTTSGFPTSSLSDLGVESGNLTLRTGFPTSVFSGQNPDSTVLGGIWESEGVGSNSESPRFWPRFQIPGFLEEFGSLVVTDGVGSLGVQSLVVTVSGGPVPKIQDLDSKSPPGLLPHRARLRVVVVAAWGLCRPSTSNKGQYLQRAATKAAQCPGR